MGAHTYVDIGKQSPDAHTQACIRTHTYRHAHMHTGMYIGDGKGVARGNCLWHLGGIETTKYSSGAAACWLELQTLD